MSVVVKYKRSYEVSYYNSRDIFKIKVRNNKENELLKINTERSISCGSPHKIEKQREVFDTKEQADNRVKYLRQDPDNMMIRISSFKEKLT